MEKNIEFLKSNIIAHRGMHNNNDIPENSLKAFEKAVEDNYIIELDVHLTKDGKVVVVHDDNLKRLTGNDVKVIESNYDEIKKMKLLNTNECIPTIQEVLDLVNGKVPIIVELKYDRKAGELEPVLADILDKYSGKFAVKSFDPYTIRWFKKNRPEYIRGLLIGYKYRKFKDQVFSRNLYLWISKPDFISCEYKLFNNRTICKYKRKCLSLAWVIKNKDCYNSMKNSFDNLICENIEEII